MVEVPLGLQLAVKDWSPVVPANTSIIRLLTAALTGNEDAAPATTEPNRAVITKPARTDRRGCARLRPIIYPLLRRQMEQSGPQQGAMEAARVSL
jgi:hypothetical protein